MAQVYLAYDPSFRRKVAIKLIAPAIRENLVLRARFEREALLIAAIEHPAIVPVYDFGEQDDQLYMVMRFMPGGSVYDLLRKGALDSARALQILSQIAPALDAVHAQGIVHRDLKPANILLDNFGNAAIADFGIAYLNDATSELTGEAIIGTPSYMSPEQVRADRDLDGRSDVYALGVISFEMLAGRQPYRATTPLGLAMKHISEPVPSIQSFRADLPMGIDAIFDKAMAKDRDQRHMTATELVSALHAVLNATEMPPPTVEPTISAPIGQVPTELESPVGQPEAIPSPEPDARLAAPAVEKQLPGKAASEKAGDWMRPEAMKADSQAQDNQRDSGLGARQRLTRQDVPSHPLPKPKEPPAVRMERAAVPAKPTGVPAAPVQAAHKRGLNWRSVFGLAALAAVAFFFCITLLLALQVGSNWLGKKSTLTSTQTPNQALEQVTTPALPGSEPGNQDAAGPETVLAFDDFSNPDSGWPVGSDRQGEYGYSQGYYFLRVLELDTLIWAGPDAVYQDVRVSVDATWNSTEQSGYYGLLCRIQDEFNYYYFVMMASGREYSIGKYIDGQFHSLLPGGWNSSDAIQAGIQTSSLQAVCAGNTLSFYVNDVKLNEVQDIVYSSGQTGVVAAALGNQAEVLFDNYRVETTAP